MAVISPRGNRDDEPHGLVPPTQWRTLALVVWVGLVLRVIAAVLIQWYAQRIGKPCLFGDTFIYWDLAQKIRQQAPFEVNQFGIRHFALRTPGYPLFLACCQTLFGPSYLAVRLVQALLNTGAIVFLYRLCQNTLPATFSPFNGYSVAVLGAGLAAVEPYGVGLEALILSEGVFIPLMLAGLWGLSSLWKRAGATTEARGGGALAFGTGVIHGAAILVRPSWALILPVLLAAWGISAAPRIRAKTWKNVGLFIFAIILVMTPWWLRNVRLIGRFVPTALWVGASLYDGISPGATGASDMRFLEEPGIVDLDESAQDSELRRRSVEFARGNPGRVLELAWIKFLRFWSPWPNAETLRSPIIGAISALVTIPLFALVGIGLWDRRRDFRALILLASPLVYFLILHMVFVSSIRYRIPGFLPALGLAAIGLQRCSHQLRLMATNPDHSKK